MSRKWRNIQIVEMLAVLGISAAGWGFIFFLLSFFYDDFDLPVIPFILLIFFTWIYGLWENTRKRKTMKKLEDIKIKTVVVDSLSQLKMLYDNSAITWEGISEKEYGLVMSVFCDDGIDGEAYITTGKVMNDLCHLTGTNAYPDDLRILSILKYREKYESLDKESIHKYGARWMDDIIDNNAEREGYRPF